MPLTVKDVDSAAVDTFGSELDVDKMNNRLTSDMVARQKLLSMLEARNRELKREIVEMESTEENKKLMEKLGKYKNGVHTPISGCSGGLQRCESGGTNNQNGGHGPNIINCAQEIACLDDLRELRKLDAVAEQRLKEHGLPGQEEERNEYEAVIKGSVENRSGLANLAVKVKHQDLTL